MPFQPTNQSRQEDFTISRISMETAGLPLPGYHYIAPNHIVKAPIH